MVGFILTIFYWLILSYMNNWYGFPVESCIFVGQKTEPVFLKLKLSK